MDLFYRMEWPCHSVIFSSGACFFGVLAGLFGCYQAYLVYKIHGMDEIFALGTGFYLVVIGSLAVIFTTYIDLMGNRMINKPKA